MSTNIIDPATATAAKSERRRTKSKGGRKSAKSAKQKQSRQSKADAKPKARRANKKAEVIDLMRRPSGATLAEVMETTGWQKHTVRGFVSILGSKGGHDVESAKNAAGERTYRIAK